MKLKTLKDLMEDKRYTNQSGTMFIDSAEKMIRAEAIKWVKDCSCFKACKGCEKLMKFTDITEEELSNE